MSRKHFLMLLCQITQKIIPFQRTVVCSYLSPKRKKKILISKLEGAISL